MGIFFLPVNQVHKSVLQPQRRQCQLVPHQGLGIPGQHVKHRCGILSDGLGTCHKSNVRIQLGGGIIIISRPQMYVTSNAVFLPAHNQCDFTVGLQSQQPIYDMTTRFFQLFGPYNIVFLVKSGFQFHKYRHLFAIVRRLLQRRYNR